MLCQFKMPGTFTVKAGFNMPSKQSSYSSTSGSLTPVETSEWEREDREPREFSDYSTIITAQSLDSARHNNILAGGSNSASQRHSRTLTNNLFGGQQVGKEEGLGLVLHLDLVLFNIYEFYTSTNSVKYLIAVGG